MYENCIIFWENVIISDENIQKIILENSKQDCWKYKKTWNNEQEERYRKSKVINWEKKV